MGSPSNSEVVLGQMHGLEGTQLTYDARWLTDTSFLLKNWVVLHRVLGNGFSQVGNWTSFWLSAMAFGGKIDKSMLYIMAGFAILPELRHNHLPSASSFHLDRGVKPKAHEISQALLSAYKPINHCPESRSHDGMGKQEAYTYSAKTVSFRGIDRLL